MHAGVAKQSEEVECGSLVFTTERVVKIRGGQRVLSFTRDGVERIRIEREPGSEYPLQEFLWAIGLAVGGAFGLRSGFSGRAFGTVALGIVLCALSTWITIHIFRRTPILTIQSARGAVRVDIEAKLSEEQLSVVRERVRQLQWPLW